MADVAASGGYYMAMAAGVILAEKLTITGSIGVVTGIEEAEVRVFEFCPHNFACLWLPATLCQFFLLSMDT